jgi:1-acyl-sn-glycerol-3-phosphate acyltransferase
MLRRLDRAWRVVATGLAFAFIFAGGGLLAATVLPCLALWPGDPRERSQRVIRATFRVYLATLQAIRLIRLQTEGLDGLAGSGGAIVIANHPSLLDVVMLMAFIPRSHCIVKHQLWTSWLLGGLVRRAGYIRNDLDGGEMLAACRESLARGAALIIFPEGTRSRPGAPPRFQRGFANLALLTGAPVLPVVITCDPPTLTKGEAWWVVPERRPVFRLCVGEKTDAAVWAGTATRALAARRLVRAMEQYYAERIGASPVADAAPQPA